MRKVLHHHFTPPPSPFLYAHNMPTTFRRHRHLLVSREMSVWAIFLTRSQANKLSSLSHSHTMGIFLADTHPIHTANNFKEKVIQFSLGRPQREDDELPPAVSNNLKVKWSDNFTFLKGATYGMVVKNLKRYCSNSKGKLRNRNKSSQKTLRKKSFSDQENEKKTARVTSNILNKLYIVL